MRKMERMRFKAINYDLYWKRNCFIGDICDDFELIPKSDGVIIKLSNLDEYLTLRNLPAFGNSFELEFSNREPVIFKVSTNGKAMSFEYNGKLIRHRCKKLYLEEGNDSLFFQDSKFIPIDKDKFMVAWLCPYPIHGSGGIRTLLNAAKLCTDCVDLWIKVQPWEVYSLEDVKKLLKEYDVNSDTFNGIFIYRTAKDIPNVYNTIYCTNPYTTYDCNEMKLSTLLPEKFRLFGGSVRIPRGKILLMQDTEWYDDFKASQTTSKWLMDSYCLDMSYITICNYLGEVLRKNFNKNPANVKSVQFEVSKNYINKHISREDAVCILYQPEKKRRNPTFTLEVAKTLTEKGIKVYLYGGAKVSSEYGTSLGLLTIDECVSLYNTCKIGFIVQCTNPSRIPLEMVSCGLDVVTLNTIPLPVGNLDYDKEPNVFISTRDNAVSDIISKLNGFSYERSPIDTNDRETKMLKHYTERTVSFDLYDTLITRKYNVNQAMSLIVDSFIKDFVHKKVEAHKRAREKFPDGNYTLSDIYKEFDGTPEIQKYLEKLEVQLEIDAAIPMEENVLFYKSLPRKVITTDMYLTMDVIINILRKCNIPYEKVFLSSERKSKMHGLFDIILKELDILPEQLFHVGDMQNADQDSSGSSGISSILLPYIKHATRISPSIISEEVKPKYPDNYLKLLNATTVSNVKTVYDKVIHDTAMNVIAPFNVIYTLWCLEKCRQLHCKRILFCSRDGIHWYKLAKYFQEKGFFTELNIEYLYNSRQIVHPLTLNITDFTTKEILFGKYKWIVHRPEEILTKRMILKRLLIPTDGCTEIDKPLDYEEVHAFIDTLVKDKESIISNAIKLSINVKKYMDYWLNEPVVIVDSGWFGKMINSIREIYKENEFIYGLFITLFEYKKVHESDINLTFLDCTKYPTKIPVQQLFEAFLSIDSGTVIGITPEGYPILNMEEKEKIEWGVRLQNETALTTGKKLFDIHGLEILTYSEYIVERFVNFCLRPNKNEAYVYGLFPYSSDQVDTFDKHLAEEGSKNPIWYEGAKMI
jgi:FMN phosphatase YigB (HAD superfamily)